jgi:hypothetical protein
MTALLADLMMREQAELAAAVLDSVDSVDGVDSVEPVVDWPDRIASGAVRTVVALRGNDLFRRMIDVDPEWVLPYLLHRRGRFQDALLDVLANRISQGQAEGEVRDGEPLVLARAVLLAAHGYALSVRSMTDDAVGETALDDELTDMLRRYLTP